MLLVNKIENYSTDDTICMLSVDELSSSHTNYDDISEEYGISIYKNYIVLAISTRWLLILNDFNIKRYVPHEYFDINKSKRLTRLKKILNCQ